MPKEKRRGGDHWLFHSLKLVQYNKTIIAGEFLTLCSASNSAEKTQVKKTSIIRKKNWIHVEDKALSIGKWYSIENIIIQCRHNLDISGLIRGACFFCFYNTL